MVVVSRRHMPSDITSGQIRTALRRQPILCQIAVTVDLESHLHVSSNDFTLKGNIAFALPGTVGEVTIEDLHTISSPVGSKTLVETRCAIGVSGYTMSIVTHINDGLI